MSTRKLVVVCALSSLALSACKLTDKEKLALEQAAGNGVTLPAPGPNEEGTVALPTATPAPVCEEQAPSQQCFESTHVQPDAIVTKKIDLLFVTDTSGSIVDERKAIANGIGAFVDELPRDIDLRVAVMPAHGSRGSHAGQFVKAKNEPYVLDLTQMKIIDLRYWLVQKLTNPPVDNFADGGEEGMYSLQRSMDNGMITSNRAHGFYRQDAALAVVFIADENDICARYPAGVKPVYDTEKVEPVAFKRDCANITPETTIAKLKALQADRPLLVAGVLYLPGTNYPRVGENEAGYGYLETIKLANGLAVDLNSGRMQDGLRAIGSLTTKKLNLKTEFKLDHAGSAIDSTSLRVNVDGREVPFEFLAASSEVHLTGDAGQDRSRVAIRYCLSELLPAPTPRPECATPTPTPTPDPTATPTPVPSPSPTPGGVGSEPNDPAATPVPSPTPATGPGYEPTDPTSTPAPTPTPVATPRPGATPLPPDVPDDPNSNF